MKGLIPDSAAFVFVNGCSDLKPYKRRREVYRGVTLHTVRELAKQLGLVGRASNMGDNLLFTERNLDLRNRDSFLKPYISFATPKNTDSEVSIMEVWYSPEPCTQEEADKYFQSKTSTEAREKSLG